MVGEELTQCGIGWACCFRNVFNEKLEFLNEAAANDHIMAIQTKPKRFPIEHFFLNMLVNERA